MPTIVIPNAVRDLLLRGLPEKQIPRPDLRAPWQFSIGARDDRGAG